MMMMMTLLDSIGDGATSRMRSYTFGAVYQRQYLPTANVVTSQKLATSYHCLRVLPETHLEQTLFHERSGVVYNFGCVCLSLCHTITFESLDI